MKFPVDKVKLQSFGQVWGPRNAASISFYRILFCC